MPDEITAAESTSTADPALRRPLVTRLSFSAWQKLAMGIVCVGLGLWGAYDLWVVIPRQEAAHQRYLEADARLKELETSSAGLNSAEYAAAKQDLNAAMPGGEVPGRPGKWDRFVQWMFLLCLPFGIPFLLQFKRIANRKYTLDENEVLHYVTPEDGASSLGPEQIRDIDMSRWMAKSMAVVVSDEKRLPLDAYFHRNLELIIGNIAHRFAPDEWHRDGRKVKPAADADAPPPDDPDTAADAIDADAAEADAVDSPDDFSNREADERGPAHATGEARQ